MYDAVWMTLTRTEKKKKVTLMFGPGGITGFEAKTETSTTLTDSKGAVQVVDESPEYIMGVLAKIRRTQGVMDVNEEQDEETGSETQTPVSKETSSVHEGVQLLQE